MFKLPPKADAVSSGSAACSAAVQGIREKTRSIAKRSAMHRCFMGIILSKWFLCNPITTWKKVQALTRKTEKKKQFLKKYTAKKRISTYLYRYIYT